MRLTAWLAIVVALAGCSKDPGESAKSTEPSKLGSALQGSSGEGSGAVELPDFAQHDTLSADHALSPENWKPAIGSALPVSADAVQIRQQGSVLTFATSVQAGRTDIDYVQPIAGDFRLTLRVGVRSQMTERAQRGPVATNAWFQVHPPANKGHNVAAPIFLREPSGTAVIQILRSGDDVRCLCDGQPRGSRRLSGPLQFGVWINGVGEVDVYEFTLEEVTPQFAAGNPSSGSGNFGNGSVNPHGGAPPGLAGAPPGFGPGPPGMQGGFDSSPPNGQGGFGNPAPAGGGFGASPNEAPPSGTQNSGDAAIAASAAKSNDSPVESQPASAIPVLPDPLSTELAGEPLSTYPLPAPVSRVIVGGGGKFLLLHFPQIEKLGLYDVEQGKITLLLTLRGNPYIAAGAEHLIIISDSGNAIAKLRLSDFRIESRGQLPDDLKVLGLVMGSASAGPAMLLVPGDTGRVSAKFIDVHSLAVIDPRPEIRIEAEPAHNPFRAAAGGRVFTVSGQPVQMVIANGTEITRKGHTRLNTLLVDSSGRTLFSDKGLWDTRMKPIDAIAQSHPAIPAAMGPFYLSVEVNSQENETEAAGPVALHVLPSGRRVALFNDLLVAANPTTFRSGSLLLDQRLVLHPASGTIVAIDEANDKLHIKRFDLKGLLDKTTADYLYVTSQPQPSIQAGADYHYQLDVLTNSDAVEYEVASGPAEMSVSPSGLVSWQTTAGDGDKLFLIAMNVKAASGEGALHTFAVRVTAQPQLANSTPASPPPATVAAVPPSEKPMAKPGAAAVPGSSPAPGYGDADVAREPPPKYLDPGVFGFDIPAGETTLPEDQRVTTIDEDGEGVVAMAYVDVGENRIVMLPNGKLVTRSKEESPLTERPFRPATRKEITDQLEKRFPRFTRNATRHFSYVYNTSPNFYAGTSRILETMLPGLQKFIEDQGIKPEDPKVPMVVIMFRTEAEFRLHGAPAGALAYYSIKSNEIVMHAESPLWKTNPELAFKDTIATIAHEGAHQILANIGVQKRLSMWPMWLSEGLAEYLSPTSFGRDLRWKGAGASHDLRMSELEFYFKSRGLEETDEDMIKYSVAAYRLSASGYASAWALTHHLANNETEAFAAHLRDVSARQPLERPGDILSSGLIPQNLELFTKHFGDDLPAMERQLLEHLKKLPYVDPYAKYVHFLATIEWRQDGKQRREVNVFPLPELARKWVSDKRKVLGEAGVTRASTDIREFKNRLLAEQNGMLFLGK